MFRSTFFRRLFIPYLALIGLAIVGVGLFAAVRVRQLYLADRRLTLHDDLILLSHLLEDDLQNERHQRVQQRIVALGQQLGRRITIIRDDGVVIADNWADPASMENHAARPEILGALRRVEDFSTRFSGTIRGDMLYLARQIRLAAGPVYYARAAVLLGDLNKELRVLYWALAGAVLAVLLLAGLIAFQFARRRSGPIVEISHVAQAIAQGDLQQRAMSDEAGEIGTLARATNTLADSLSRALQQARQDRAELLAILASMSDGVIAVDIHQHIRLANDAAGALFGFRADEVMGRPLWQVVRLDRILKAANQVLQTRQPQIVQVSPSPGRYVEARLRCFPPDKPPEGLVLVAHDTTQSVRYQELRKEFVANVSHELRTPLSVICGFAETLAAGALKDPEKGPQYVEMIHRHARQLTNLVNDLLALSRLESQPDLPHTGPVDLPALARKAVDLLMPAAQSKNQTVTLELAEVSPVIGNSDYLERAIVNLIDNAIKYTPDGGRIQVAVRPENDCVLLEVTDNGIGIPEQDIPRIFERFYRVDRSRSREMGGTGLGLSIVKHVAQVHGGSVNVTSTVGQGSTFSLRIPAHREEA